MPVIHSGKYTIETSHEEKVLFAPSNITKGDLIHYYEKIAPHMLPYMKDRPLTMVRYPNGIDQEGFYQKDAPDYFPSWIKRVAIAKKEDGMTHYVVCNQAATLIYLANQNCITPHVWLSRIDRLNYPDRMIFDIDPGPNVSFAAVKQTALHIKDVLHHFNLESFAMVTGSRGIHVVVPLIRNMPFLHVRHCARYIASLIANENPKEITIDMCKSTRVEKIFLDYLRNGFGATAVTPYAVRPLPNAPIATPVSWQQVASKELQAQSYTLNTIFDHLNEIKDPWSTFFKKRYSSLSCVS